MDDGKKFKFFFIALIVIGGAFFFLFNQTPEVTGQAGSAQAAAPAAGHGMQQAPVRTGTNPGDNAPDFSLTTVDGKTVSLSDFKGEKPVLLYFGATWCPNCRRDLTAVQSVYEEYKDDVEFLAVGVDTRENARVLSKYQEDMGLQSLTFAPGSGTVNNAFNVRFTTHKVGIDRDGKVAFTRVGAVSPNDWHQMFRSLV